MQLKPYATYKSQIMVKSLVYVWMTFQVQITQPNLMTEMKEKPTQPNPKTLPKTNKLSVEPILDKVIKACGSFG